MENKITKETLKIKTKFKIGDRVYNKIFDRIAEIKEIFTHTYKTKSGNIKRRIYYTLIGIGEELIEQKYCFAVKDKCYQCKLPFVDCKCCENLLNIKKKIEMKKRNKGGKKWKKVEQPNIFFIKVRNFLNKDPNYGKKKKN